MKINMRSKNATVRVPTSAFARDPAGTTRQMRTLADRLMFATNSDPDTALPACEALAQLVRELDDHLSKGGKMPPSWRRACRCR